MQEKRQIENMLLRRQCDEIQNYISRYPSEEKEQRIIEWIEKYAMGYRKNMESIIGFVNRTLK
ncbi:MAG: hypothetical protein HQM14_07420 [SAR324 cluster bacterium]|nr:hypothetical protein [SAR324 cluster bacterium]